MLCTAVEVLVMIYVYSALSPCSLATQTLLVIKSLLLLDTAVLCKLAFMFVAMMYKTLTLNEWYRQGIMCLWECCLSVLYVFKSISAFHSY